MDRHEFARKYEAAFGRLWLIAAGAIGDRSAADDIVQESAIIAYKKLHSFRDGTNFEAWASQIVRYCAANHKRKSKGRNTHPIDPATLDLQPQDSNSPELVRSGGEIELEAAFDDQMLRGLSQLTGDARTCLLLRVVDELSYTDIASLTGIPASTAMSHVHRSKIKLRQTIQDEHGEKAVPND